MGYREGIDEGSESVYQDGFDKGYEEGFPIAFALGKFKGLSTLLPNNVQHPSKIKQILEKTRRGECYVCSLESDPKKVMSPGTKEEFQSILCKQVEHSEETIETLKKYFQTVFKDQEVDIESMSFSIGHKKPI